ncbi:hypothetical protein ACUXCC_005534 [Cytobacillus horneckiae]|uniref:hypothetical protein n=1 Tax=Cytobacillus horneckiae TaxID=549687 RepID=UPI0019D1E2C2|nr:hypothetical protein [Cytobacillus horneckiae]MBN6890043.1 hypothetical protein [Cytobacillus horneckiae]
MLIDLIDLLRSDGFITVNKKLANNIGLNAAVMYSELLAKYKYFSDKNQLTKDGFFYNTVEGMQRDTSLSKDQQQAAIKVLENLNLIEKQNRGLPRKRHFKINLNEDNLKRVLQSQQLEEKPPTSKRENRKQVEGKSSINNNKDNNNYKNNKKSYRGQNSVIDRLSFSQYLVSIDKNKFSTYDSEQMAALQFFVECYKHFRETEHPNLTIEQWEDARTTMLMATDENMETDMNVDSEGEKLMITSYFDTYYKDCNYSVLHYISGNLRAIRYYDTVH